MATPFVPSARARFLAPLLILAAFRLPAQDPPPPPANEAVQPPAAAASAQPAGKLPAVDETITVTATRTPRRLLEAPGTVSVITAEDIEKRMATDNADLVRYEPGLSVSGDPTRRGLNGFNIRGIGGNRVLTQIDGIRTSEQFDFGPIGASQISIDVDELDSVEILRSAGSSLYGSDALGGVVSLRTKDPADYLLGGRNLFADARLLYDGRRGERGGNLAVASGTEHWQASLFAGRRNGGESDNFGRIVARNASRTAPNPIDRDATNLLAKLVWLPSASNTLKLTADRMEGRADTLFFSGQGVQDLGSTIGPGVTFLVDTASSTANDRQDRMRISLDQLLVLPANPLADSLSWRLYSERGDSRQRTVELRRTTIGGGPLGPISTADATRTGTFRFEQDRVGGELQWNKSMTMQRGPSQYWTAGISATRNDFDMLRTRVDIRDSTGAVIPSSTPYPTKYFPASQVTETGAYVQDEVRFGTLTVIPGIRYDHYALDADRQDAVFLSGNPGTLPPANTTVGAFSPRVALIQRLGDTVSAFAQYARGFRTPPYSDVNNGFTNVAFGYTTLPNPDLKPETSANYELGLRAATSRFGASAVVFNNRFHNFINTATVGVDRATGLLQFQQQNVDEARIRGLELSGEARLGDHWQLRGAASALRGDNQASHLPLNSVPPSQLAAGLRYTSSLANWGGELATTIAAAKSESRIDTSQVRQFATPSYRVVDLTAYRDLGTHLRIQAGVFNITDEKYWTWQDVIGQSATSPVLDRYTSPGRSVSLSLLVR